MLERTEIECACGSNGDKTKLVIRPLHPEIETSVPLVEIEIQGNDKVFLDADGIDKLFAVLMELQA